MSDRVRFDRVAPVLPVLDLEAALNLYARLGFTVGPYTVASDMDSPTGVRYLPFIEWHESPPHVVGRS